MSLSVLKKKSRRFQARVSGKGKNGFSLNGGHRNIGSVGVTNLAKSVTRTRFRGALPMGAGSKQGKYPVVVSNSGSCCNNDASIIKKSVLNTKGMLHTSYAKKWDENEQLFRCPRVVLSGGQYPHIWVQEDDTLAGNTSQGQYIHSVVRKHASCVIDKKDAGIKTCNADGGKCIVRTGGKIYVRKQYAKNFNQQSVDSSTYQRGGLMKKNCLPSPDILAPFPNRIVHNGCNKDILNVTDAIMLGYLPEHHVDAA